MKNEIVKNLTEDALFCGLFITLLIVLAPLFGLASDFFGIAMTSIFACLNQSKGHLRVLCISTVLLVLLTIFSSPYQLLSQYIWRVASGWMVSRFLHFKKITYYMLSFFSLLGLRLTKIAFTITILTPMTIAEYVSNFTEHVQQLLECSGGIILAVPVTIVYIIGMVILQCVIISRLNMLYKKYILKKKSKTVLVSDEMGHKRVRTKKASK